MAKSPLVSVFELANSTKKEFMVWIVEDGQQPTGTALEGLRPAHWNADDHVFVNTIESGLGREAALAFRELYAKNLGQMPGWSVWEIDPES